MNNNYITKNNVLVSTMFISKQYIIKLGQHKPWITTLELMGNRRGVSMNWLPTFLGSTHI